MKKYKKPQTELVEVKEDLICTSDPFSSGVTEPGEQTGGSGSGNGN